MTYFHSKSYDGTLNPRVHVAFQGRCIYRNTLKENTWWNSPLKSTPSCWKDSWLHRVYWVSNSGLVLVGIQGHASWTVWNPTGTCSKWLYWFNELINNMSDYFPAKFRSRLTMVDGHSLISSEDAASLLLHCLGWSSRSHLSAPELVCETLFRIKWIMPGIGMQWW